MHGVRTRKALTPETQTRTHLLHQSISNRHTGELLSAAMRPLFAMSTQPRNLGEVEVELLHEPVDRIAGLVGQDVDEVVPSQLARGLFGVGEAGAVSREDQCAGRKERGAIQEGAGLEGGDGYDREMVE